MATKQTDVPALKDPREHYIINTQTKSNKMTGIDFEYHDYNVNPAVQELKQKAANGTLKDEKPGLPNNAYLCANADNWIMPEHTTSEVVRYASDENGWVWVPKSELAVAKRILKSLRAMDPGVSVHPIGLQFELDPEKVADTPKSTLRQRIQSR